MTQTNFTLKCLVCSHLAQLRSDPSIRACELDLEPDTCEDGNREKAEEFVETKVGAAKEVKKGDEPTAAQQRAIDEVGAWIDGDVIAGVIAEEMVDEGVEVTSAKMMDVWLKVLETLHVEVEATVNRLYG